MRPCYVDHDQVYRRLRDSGALGWGHAGEQDLMLKVLRPWLPPQPDRDRLLELGCGAGNLSVQLAAQGYAVTGVDISPAAVQWARDRAAQQGINAEFLVADVVTMNELRGSHFDHVVDSHCLHCIVGEDRGRCLEALRSAMAPGARFYLMSMVGEVLDPVRRSQFDPDTFTVFQDGRPVRHVGTTDSVATELESHGFRIEHLQVTPRATAADQDDLFIVAGLAR